MNLIKCPQIVFSVLTVHPIVGESLTELISHNEENTEGIAQLKHHKSNCMKNVVEI